MLLEWSFAIFSGLTLGMAAFLVAAGLTLVFGILKILNFAHGTFFMLGAYVTYSILGTESASMAAFLLATLAAGVVVGGAGWATDLVIFRRLRDSDYHYTLIATFALLLLITGLVKIIWGLDFRLVRPPEVLETTWFIGGIFIPAYSVFVIAAGIVVFLILDFGLQRSWIGKTVQSVARDPWMAEVLGINNRVVMTAAVVVSFMLAGIAGGLLLPNQSLSPALGDVFLLLAFTAVIIGGLGNVRGAFIASILLGLIESVSTVLLPDLPGISIFVALIVFILVRPQGIFSGAQ
ncbi:branched-chain amino acid ABC transporter permease [Nitratireductor aestuarii]|uniref:Branched-chain amino acid ABC transporter permease n=1 Tax=Nitratireductor aestuarii TaxID=1735103 RepID=A0A916S1F7_9HYPH|nr:branched-chain amino acid ABC transporter permease [Nitratireductor aestuarii]GGA79097.1 branched-chain amino acid ABC transporter permease [Nitratireductor aestuarii]